LLLVSSKQGLLQARARRGALTKSLRVELTVKDIQKAVVSNPASLAGSRSRVVEEIAARMEESRPAANEGKKGRPSEGARLHAQLESAADPETVLLSMTATQHTAMAAFQQQQQVPVSCS
jgi:hypothetical protein